MTNSKAVSEIVKETCSGCMGSDSNESHRCNKCGYSLAIKALEENDKLKAEIEQLNNKLCFNEPAIKEMQNSNHSKDDINFLIKENFDLAYVNKKLSDEIEQLKLYATNLINTRNLSEETATSIRAKMQRELMMQKEIEQLKAELEKLNYNPGGYQFG